MHPDTIRKVCESLKHIPDVEISLSGGEPTLWWYINEGCDVIREYKNIYLTINSNCVKVDLLSQLLKTNKIDCVFTDTANTDIRNVDKLKEMFPNKIRVHEWENAEHKKPPIEPIEDSLPASCGCHKIGIIGNYALVCPNFFSIVNRIGRDVNYFIGQYVFSLDDGWLQSILDIGKDKFTMEVCKYCLANNKVWDKI